MKMTREKKIERFDRKYAKKGGFAKLKEMVENFATLEEIGRYFGFSRQNAAGIYTSLFGGRYREIQLKRKEKVSLSRVVKLQNLDERLERLKQMGRLRSFKKTLYVKLVKEEAEKFGLKVEFASAKAFTPKLRINGFLTSISGTDTKTVYHIPKDGSPTVYFRFAISFKEHDFSVFVLDEGNSNYTFYVIPFHEIRDLHLITLRPSYENPRRKGRNGSKYVQYRNAWHLFQKVPSEAK
ncbi:MAG: hypothetical protein ABIK73_09245 [candidate division WOR-3 bacterium]